jgi:DNA polymerase-1
MKEKPKLLVLLDSHAIIHRAYHALPDFMSSDGVPTGALYGLSNMLMKIVSDLKPDYIVACYDLPQKTFRHEAYDAYKAGRAKADDALVAQLISSRKIFDAFNIPIYDAPGFEADDELGTICEILKKENINIIIASGDMDTMQLVDDKKVQVYTLKKGITDTILYDEEKVFERFGFAPKFLPDYKGLRGDPSDNIIGIKGIGEKTATTLVSKFGTIENIYKQIKKDETVFKALGITPRILDLIKNNEEEAMFSKVLATIRRDAPIDFKLPEKTFWENISFEKIEKTFLEFGFRSLMTRLKGFFGTQEASEQLENFLEDEEESEISPEKIEEASLLLWILNTEISNPKKEDIINYAKNLTKNYKITFNEAYDVIYKEVEKKNLLNIYKEIELPILPIVKAMGERGILIDQKYFEKLSKDYHKSLDSLTEKIYKLAGEEFNINSPKQLGEILFVKMGIKNSKKKNASGNFSTKIEILEELEEDNPIISLIMEYRELQKLLSTYIDVIPKMAGSDGRLHSKFIQNATTTGRFSSLDPNLQNLPVKTELGKKIRDGFVAVPGYKLCSLDYSQIELRTIAILSGDKKMTEIFKEGKDIHAGVASFVFGVPIDKVDSEMRRRAKVINFGIIYGMGVTALRKNLGKDVSRVEAQKFYDNYFNQFSGVRDYLEGVKAFAKKNSYTETLFGRKRYFKDINSRIPFLASMAERTAINAPVQGTAADIIKLAILFAWQDLKEANLLKDAYLILQIHDELVFEIKEEALEKAIPIIKNAMEKVLERSYLKSKTDIPIIVNYKVGDSLGDVK